MVITYIVLCAAAIYTIYLLTKMMKAEVTHRVTDPAEIKVLRKRLFRRMFYGIVSGTVIAYGLLSLIQPDLFWAIFNPRKVSTVTQGMLSRSFYILAMSLFSLFIGGIPGAVIALLSRRWKGKPTDSDLK